MTTATKANEENRHKQGKEDNSKIIVHIVANGATKEWTAGRSR